MNPTSGAQSESVVDLMSRAKETSAEMNRLLELIYQLSPGRHIVYSLQLSLLVVIVICSVRWSIENSIVGLIGLFIAGSLVVVGIVASILMLRDGLLLARRVSLLRRDLADRLFESDRIAYELIKHEKSQLEPDKSRSFKEFFLRLHSSARSARDELSRKKLFERL